MPHVSRNALDEKTKKKIEKKLLKVLTRCSSKERADIFVDSLFSETEKIMFAKRVVLIVMLNEGYSFEKIGKVLKMSESTVVRFWKKMKCKKYDSFLLVLGRAEYAQVLDDLYDLITLKGIMPPIAGRGRWKNLYKTTKRRR